jgi:dolichyl-phosphate-mannose--protein O-mannosyl transferase
VISNDIIEQQQRKHARTLGLCLGAGFLSLVVVCIIIFSQVGLPKDPKEWKRQQEQQRLKNAERDSSGNSSATTKEVSP